MNSGRSLEDSPSITKNRVIPPSAGVHMTSLVAVAKIVGEKANNIKNYIHSV